MVCNSLSLSLSLSYLPYPPPTCRDVVQAMQDPNAGLKLHEMKAKGARQTTRYFTGKELLDWLITWSFASDRSEASSMATHAEVWLLPPCPAGQRGGRVCQAEKRFSTRQ